MLKSYRVEFTTDEGKGYDDVATFKHCPVTIMDVAIDIREIAYMAGAEVVRSVEDPEAGEIVMFLDINGEDAIATVRRTNTPGLGGLNGGRIYQLNIKTAAGVTLYDYHFNFNTKAAVGKAAKRAVAAIVKKYN